MSSNNNSFLGFCRNADLDMPDKINIKNLTIEEIAAIEDFEEFKDIVNRWVSTVPIDQLGQQMGTLADKLSDSDRIDYVIEMFLKKI